MISFNYESDYQLVNENSFVAWISKVILSEDGIVGEINYIFCDDEYLLKINQAYLRHDTYTDIITFDYTDGKIISSDIFVSIERVKENALEFKVAFQEELLRVMSHGVLHLLGYGDKTSADVKVMRLKEEEKMALFHVEQ